MSLLGIDGSELDPCPFKEDVEVAEAFAPMSVTLRLEDDLDVSRGDMICRVNNAPVVTQDLEATVCWMTDKPALRRGSKLAIKHTTRTARAVIRELMAKAEASTRG